MAHQDGVNYCPWVNLFENFCSSSDLCLEEIMEWTEDNKYRIDTLQGSSFLHRVCMNTNVTLEIVECLLEFHPQSVFTSIDIPNVIYSAYPLHLACCNKECPDEVIQLLLKKIEKESRLLDHLTHDTCYIDFKWSKWGSRSTEDGYNVGGTPLHFYLSRTSNVDIDIVKQLLANPEALLLADEQSKCTPIHIIMYNKSIGDMFDLLRYLVESNPSSLKAKNVHERVPLHIMQ